MIKLDISNLDPYGFGSVELMRFSLSEHYYKKCLTEGVSYQITLRIKGKINIVEFNREESEEPLRIETYVTGDHKF